MPDGDGGLEKCPKVSNNIWKALSLSLLKRLLKGHQHAACGQKNVRKKSKFTKRSHFFAIFV
jgi:hypothetical protein